MVVTTNVKSTKKQLEKAAGSVLKNLAVSKKKEVSHFSDVFDQVLYVSPSKVTEKLVVRPRSIDAIKSAISVSSTSLDSIPDPSSMEPKDLAAARILEPKKTATLESALQVVRSAVVAADQQQGTPTLIPNFGRLMDSTLARAKQDFRNEGGAAAVYSSKVFQQLSQELEQELESELLDEYQKQLSILQLTAYEGFKKRLSQLRITPGLPYEMEQIVAKSVDEFATLARTLLAKSLGETSKRNAATKSAFSKKCREYTADRLLAAEASGQFKPIPRKGFTVGMHWLLPKPFGNDYRQEPWMVHATDNMVYIPKAKITEVSPSEISSGTGDWRDKVVPSPAGNDMVFMQ